MVIIRILFFVIQIANIIVLLKGILGYSFRQDGKWILAGVMMLIFKIAMEELIIPNGGIWLYWSDILVPSVGIAMLFDGRKLILFLISSCMFCICYPLESLGTGAGILLRKGVDVINMNLSLIYTVMLLIALAVTVILFLLLRKKNGSFRSYAESLNGIIFVCYLAYARMAAYRPGITFGGLSAQQAENAEIVRGWNLIKDGVSDLSIFLALVLICILVSQRREMRQMMRLNEKCIAEQTEQYRLLSRGDRELRRFRHDYNSHITALQALAEAGELEQMKDYVEKMRSVQEKFRFIRTNHIICDAILNQYCVLCRDAGFELQVRGSFPEELEIGETDFCIVLSNGIKNAYEAAVQCQAGCRKLEVEITGRGLFVFAVIRNSTVREPVIEKGIFVTTKKDRVNHGLGIRNMLNSVRKSGGSISWRYEDGEVETEIILKEKRKQPQ